MKWPQCVYKDSTVKGFEDCEYKIIHSLEQFQALGPEWGKKQREEMSVGKPELPELALQIEKEISSGKSALSELAFKIENDFRIDDETKSVLQRESKRKKRA